MKMAVFKHDDGSRIGIAFQQSSKHALSIDAVSASAEPLKQTGFDLATRFVVALINSAVREPDGPSSGLEQGYYSASKRSIAALSEAQLDIEESQARGTARASRKDHLPGW